MIDLIESLENIWLNSNQAKVYLVVLENGTSIISDIAKKALIKRTSCINYVQDLLELWYLSKSIIWKRIAYVAESPENILNTFEIKRQKFKKNLPELNNLFLNSSNHANVFYFEWLPSIRKEYHRISSGFKPIITFFSMWRYLKVLDVDDMNKFIWNIMKNQNTIRDLVEDEEETRIIMKKRKFSWKSMKYLPKTFLVNIDLIIQWDVVTMISFKKKMWVTIENKEIADFHRNLHNYFWRIL